MNKTIFGLALLAYAGTAQAQGEGTLRIKGQLTGFTDTVLVLRPATRSLNADTTMVTDNGTFDITIKLDNTQQIVSGTPLNDELFKFFNKYNQLKNQEAELLHTHDRAIMDGSDMDAVTRKLNDEAMRLTAEEDKLVTTFVTDNFDNVLGPGVFFMMTIGYRYPELTPWIEDIMSKATDKFKNDPYVKDFYQKALENQAIMNGMKDMNTAPAGAALAQPMPDGPTPNQLAQPAAAE